MMVMLNREDYWQCAYVIPKDGIDRVKAMAIQDAVAAANILAAALKERRVTNELLAAVQRRRAMPMRVIQWLQLAIQNNVLSPLLASAERPKPPFAAKLFHWFPPLRRIPARLIGLGVRPEHIRMPEHMV
jgi:2-polyprenyl-6-methoxyphenol hydroxylase-like FAD-dependent oxidoreductase